MERYLRSNIERVGGYNNFEMLKKHRNKELYIAATNLDTAERTVFGWDENNTALISEAMQASTAIPGFYKPVRIAGEDYIDGGVRNTANIGLAIEKNADLIIAYNPFRPLVSLPGSERKKVRRRIAREGIGSILNQVFRTLLHTRLHLGMERYKNDPNFTGDIILIEPAPEDNAIFDTNPVAFWRRGEAAQTGFESTIASIEEHFDDMRKIVRSYGIEMSRHYVLAELKKLQRRRGMTQNEIFDILEHRTPTNSIRLASGE